MKGQSDCAHYERAKQVCTLKEQRRGRMLMLARHLLPRGRCSAALCISTVVATACQPLRLEPHSGAESENFTKLPIYDNWGPCEDTTHAMISTYWGALSDRMYLKPSESAKQVKMDGVESEAEVVWWPRRLSRGSGDRPITVTS